MKEAVFCTEGIMAGPALRRRNMDGKLAGCGDDAMKALLQALSFAVDTLNRQCVRTLN